MPEPSTKMLQLLIFCMFAIACESYKILVVNPKFAYSHMNFMGRIADTLAEAGHDVVTLQPVLFPLANNGTTKSRLIQVQVDVPAEVLAEDSQHHTRTWTSAAIDPFDVIRVNKLFCKLIRAMISKILEEKNLLGQLKEENFDVGITELFDFTGIAVFEAVGLRNVIGTHSTSSVFEKTAYSIGTPVIPSFMPASQGVTNDSPTLYNRVVNLLFTFKSWYFQYSAAKAAQTVMEEKLGNSVRPIWDIVSDMSFILTNTEPFLEFAKPTLHKIVDLGGIGVHKPKPLDEEWDRLLSLRSQNVLISFGSVAKGVLMPAQMKSAIVEVAKLYPNTTFIWKYEKPEEAPFAAGVDNLFLSKWTPQNDLLADDRLTLFITHGGAGSLMESAFRGRPLIVVPLFADQIRNAKLVEKFGFGVILDKSSLMDSVTVGDAINRVLSGNKYHKAARRTRDILARRPFSPEEKLVKTVELAAEFGEMPELRVAGRKLGFIAYHNLDILFMLFICILFTVSLFVLFVQRLFSKISCLVKVKVQ